jgi:adenylate cyclase
MSRTILIADNEAQIRRSLAGLLAADGYKVLQAESGERAIALANEHQVDAFFLDMHLPRMSGIDLCRALRSLDEHTTTPIIFLTGRGEVGTLEELFASGCDDVVAKPVNPFVLRARLKGHLERVEYFRRLQRSQQFISRRNLEVVERTAATGMIPAPEEREIAICFTDLRGFTALAEQTDATRLFRLVSSVLAEQVEIVHRYKGYIDKFGGDGVMAIFDDADMVLQSCLCALKILDRTQTIDAMHGEDLRRVGIGIHVGRAVIGNIGSPDHLDYSAIGNAVNLAARLCGQAEATSIVVSKAVRDAAKDDERLCFHNERQVIIKGIKDPATVYTLSRASAVRV